MALEVDDVGLAIDRNGNRRFGIGLGVCDVLGSTLLALQSAKKG